MSRRRPPSNHPPSHHDHDSGKPEKREVSGGIAVHGEIKTEFPRDITEEYITSSRSDTAREERRYIVECFTLGFVFLVAVLTIIQTCQSVKSANAAKSAADTAAKQLELLDRPWISPTFTPETPIQFSGDHLSLNLRVHLKNVGHAVATNVVINHEAFLTSDPFHVVLERQKKICEKTAKDTSGINNGRLEMSLFPDREDSSWSIGANIPSAEISSNLIDTHLTPNFHDKVFGPIYLVGCVDYLYVASRNHHQTGFAYEIGRALPNTPSDVIAAMKVGDSVPVEQIRMHRWIFGGDQVY